MRTLPSPYGTRTASSHSDNFPWAQPIILECAATEAIRLLVSDAEDRILSGGASETEAEHYPDAFDDVLTWAIDAELTPEIYSAFRIFEYAESHASILYDFDMGCSRFVDAVNATFNR